MNAFVWVEGELSCKQWDLGSILRSPIFPYDFCYNVLLRSEEHTSELQSRQYPVCRLLLEKRRHTRINLTPRALFLFNYELIDIFVC